jgi:hypothetical protein
MENISYSTSSCHIVCSADSLLPELALAMEFISNHFMGRGVYRWSIERDKNTDGHCVVEAQSLMAPSEMPKILQISQVAPLGMAVHNKILPYNIPLKESFLFGANTEPLAYDGQNRRRLFCSQSEDWTESIIESRDVNPTVQLSMLSWGFADMTVGLFALGVRSLKYQISQKTSQIYIKHKLDEKRLCKYFQSQASDYNIASTVGKLP